MRKLNFQVLQNSIGTVIVDISDSFLTILALALRLAAVLCELIEAKWASQWQRYFKTWIWIPITAYFLE